MTGHTGMAVYYGSTSYVVHMPGIEKNTERISISSWFKNHSSAKVEWYVNSDKRKTASNWAK